MAERSEAGWGSPQEAIDQRQHAVQIPINLIVPEAQHPEALACKVIVTSRIVSSMRSEVVLTAVNFDDEAVLETNEIYDIGVPRGLAAEMESSFSPRAQMNPQLHQPKSDISDFGHLKVPNSGKPEFGRERAAIQSQQTRLGKEAPRPFFVLRCLSCPLPHRKSGLPDLRIIMRNRAKPRLRGGGSRQSLPGALSTSHRHAL